MIPNEQKQKVEAIGAVKTIGTFTITSKTQARILVSLSDKMYTRKQLAAIREYSTNAADAHVVVGKPISEIIVSLPTMEDTNFSVRDFGTGLTEDQIRDIYCVFGESTKRNSNEFNGLLGYGCKSGFASADSFTVTSWINGEKSVYHCVKGDSENLHSAILLSRTKSEEPAGIKVTIPVRHDDICTFHTEAFNFYKYWPELPTLVNLSPPDQLAFDEFRSTKAFLSGDGWEIRSGKNGSPKGIAYMGYVPYNIDWTVLFHKLSMDGRGRAIYDLMQNNSVIFYFKMGEVNFVDSRESLEYTDLTIKTLQERIYIIFNTIKDSIQKKFDEMPNLWEAKKLFYALFNASGDDSAMDEFKDKFEFFVGNLYRVEAAFRGEIRWRGIPLNGWHFGDINRFDNAYGGTINYATHFPADPVMDTYWRVTNNRMKIYPCRPDPNSNIIVASSKYVIVENDMGKRIHQSTVARYLLFSKDSVRAVHVLKFKNQKTRNAFFKEYNFYTVPLLKVSDLYDEAKTWVDKNKKFYTTGYRHVTRLIQVLDISTQRVKEEAVTLEELEKGGYYLDVSPSQQRRYSSRRSVSVVSAKPYHYIDTSSVVRAVRMLNAELNLNIERVYLVTQKLRNTKWFKGVFESDNWILLWGYLRTKLSQLNLQSLADAEGLKCVYWVCKSAEKYLKINIKDKNSIFLKILELNKIKEKNNWQERLESLQEVYLWSEISNSAKDSNNTKSIMKQAIEQYPLMDWHLISSEYCVKLETLKNVATYVNAMDFYHLEMKKLRLDKKTIDK